jgi:hypothetical protein
MEKSEAVAPFATFAQETKEDLKQRDLLAKKRNGSVGGYGAAGPKGL